ncbi:hypothetical protein DS838_002728 [Geotrichum bryndzae]|nr:hypothetical protein DS838_002728 [Geotrichum bryndzae]
MVCISVLPFGAAVDYSRSGVTVNDESLTAFNDLKLKKSYKYIIFSLNDTKTEIVVSKTSNAQSYDDFLGDLPENDCRYAVYDFEYDTSDSGKRSKIVFFTWSPDTAPIRVC